MILHMVVVCDKLVRMVAFASVGSFNTDTNTIGVYIKPCPAVDKLCVNTPIHLNSKIILKP